jgi:hypothetical protein
MATFVLWPPHLILVAEMLPVMLDNKRLYVDAPVNHCLAFKAFEIPCQLSEVSVLLIYCQFLADFNMKGQLNSGLHIGKMVQDYPNKFPPCRANNSRKRYRRV